MVTISDGKTSHHNDIEVSLGKCWKASLHKSPCLEVLSPCFAGALEDLNRENG